VRRRLVTVLVGTLGLVLLPAVAAEGANGHANYRAVCPAPPSGAGRCHVLVVTDRQGNPLASSSPSGLSPSTIKSVYGFPTGSTAGAGKTIAIVDAYDDPNAESDLNVFSSTFGLPSCTTANGCFKKVNQTGGTSYPRSSSGWALEISLDVQWAHAIAPGAKILLVEAKSNSLSNLFTAESYAKAHADYVSNSWGASEFSSESLYDSYFAQPGVSVFASAGDSGLPATYPSASPSVISVGGTTLTENSDGTWSEAGWSDGGGGCSAYEAATSAQAAFPEYLQAGCSGRRATPDVSLDADPTSGVAVYDTTSYSGQTGWFTVGGTSASSPMWAARSAVSSAVVTSAYVYGSSIGFRDITSGDNGAPCLVGFDLCSGRGSWFDGTSTSPSPEFSLSASPSSQTLTQGGNTSYSVSITPSGGFSSSVDLSVSGLPGGASGSFNPDPATTSATLNVTTSSSTPAGSYTLTITGTSGSLAHTTTVTLDVQAAQTGDFSLSAAPSSATVQRGNSTSYAVSITPSGGFDGQVQLSVSGLPRAAHASFSPDPATSSSTLTVTTKRSTPTGTSTLTITGTSGGLTRQTSVTLVVQ
jgi:subtilase family serine protease